MCGICGVVGYRASVDPEVLGRMATSLRHRGPDDEGFFVSEGGGPQCGLGFRRLSIIDLAGGNQPLASEDGRFQLVCNGEIYNYRELREHLRGQGHLFATESDVEVIVHLYEELGPRCLERLNGMFALAIWDDRERTLFAARDRLGKKPLYYADTGRELLFGSELKALREHPSCPGEIDADALSRYLAFEYVPSPLSILAGVQKLPAAHFLVWAEGRLTVERYWRLPPPEPERRREEDLVDEFRGRLREAVRLRLMADVPLGAFLSGGLDSSSIVALMSELAPGRVETFSVGFAERSFDESPHARRVATHFRTSHHEERFTPGVLLEVLPEVTSFLDEPFADASVLPTYLLSRFTRRSVKVALGGDGADELLAGYPTFQAGRLARLYRLPSAIHERLVLPLAERLPVSDEDFSLEFRLKRFLRGMSHPQATRHQAWLGSFTPDAQAELLRNGVARDPYSDLRRLDHATRSRHPLDRAIELYATTYLPDDILVKVDRASMACSLEVRAPFLDYTLVEFLARVPARLKLRGLERKVILKRAMAGRLPPGIASRAKKGFGIPTAKWFKRELREALLDELSPERLRRQGLFEPATVERLVRDHLDGRRDNHKELWTLFVFQLWHRHHATATTRVMASPR